MRAGQLRRGEQLGCREDFSERNRLVDFGTDAAPIRATQRRNQDQPQGSIADDIVEGVLLSVLDVPLLDDTQQTSRRRSSAAE